MLPIDYARRWFLPFASFCARIGASSDVVTDLITARAMPGAIYAGSDDAADIWWSALGGDPTMIAGDAERWFAPAAIWWGRRALLALRGGASSAEAAQINREHFVTECIAALRAEPLASGAFADAFHGGALDADAARRCALTEWDAWVDGGYAVCLTRFSGESCVRKESLARRLRRHVEGERGFTLPSQELFDLVERLEAMLLPFAPWQRASGTPGRVIDPSLAALGLGAEQPYA